MIQGAVDELPARPFIELDVEWESAGSAARRLVTGQLRSETRRAPRRESLCG
jgi:hypothetical protein